MTMPSRAALHQALRAHAGGIHPTEAGVELLINHGVFTRRKDFTGRFITCRTSATDGITPLADIRWPEAINALDVGDLPCSRSEASLLRIAASLGGGLPVELHDNLTGLDGSNTELVIAAVSHASGRRASRTIP